RHHPEREREPLLLLRLPGDGSRPAEGRVPRHDRRQVRGRGRHHVRLSGAPMRSVRRRSVLPALVLAALTLGCGATAREATDHARRPTWASRAMPEARGDFRVLPDGRRAAIRYKGWTTRDFRAFRTYAYDDARPEPAVERAPMPAGATGDPTRGRALFLDRAKGPCAGCHLVPGDDVWPAGSVGPDLSTIGDRRLPGPYLYQLLWDPRVVFPHTVMPPWGRNGVLTLEEITHVVAYLQTLTGPLPPETDADRNPFTRKKPVGFGDNLDPTNNPAILLAEDAQGRRGEQGPAGRGPRSRAGRRRSIGRSASATIRAPTATRPTVGRTSSSAAGCSPTSPTGSRVTSRRGARARARCGTSAGASSGA